MAVKTIFSAADFRAILAQYDLGDLAAFQPIQAGTVQTNYLVHTRAGRWVFRYYENRSKESVQFECAVIDYLKTRGYPCPALAKDRRGRAFGMFQGKPFAWFEFIEGEPIEHPTPEQQGQLARKAAELNRLTAHYRPPRWRSRLNYDAPHCRELAERAAGAIGSENARAKLRWHQAELESLSLPRALPKGVCHGDFHFSNLLFKEGELAALLDFDDANYTYLTFDLISLMNVFVDGFDWDTWSQFAPGADILDFRAARVTLAEYERVRPLSAIEKRHVYDVLRLGILIDCVWYFERGDVSDFFERRKLDALARLGRDRFYAELFGA